MNRQIVFTIFCFLLCISTGYGQNWQLVWQDEFNYTGAPDANKWGYDVGAGGWGNGEAQYYTNNRRENARVENGNLILEARRDWSGAEYSSARLVSRGKGDWTYGRIEIRAKIPVGQGLWPAIWMLPTDWTYGGWPASGEIDIMESFALGGLKYDKVEANVHTQAYNHTIGTNKGAGITGLSNIQDNYHTYRVTWTANKMVFDVDGREYFTFNKENSWQQWPFDKRFHLIMNIAVGGSLGTWIDPNIFPKRMEVDYVRVYQDNGVPPINPSTGLVTVYKDCNYSGFSGGLDIGDYNLAKLKSLGVQDDDISSLRITQGYQAILYQDDNFGGASTVINSNNTCLNTTWNDKVTSIRVIANGVTNLGGTYILQNRNSSMNMDVWGGSTANGANIAQANPSYTNINQQFEFTHLGNGLYKIIAKVSGKSLDVNNFNKANGANVEQYTYNATVNQQFIVVPTDLAGCYKIIARHSGKVVEVAGASTASGANVQQWDNNNQTCGQWKFLAPISPSTGLITVYNDCNYGGFSGGLEIGDYNLARLKSLGINDDAISSLRITQGYQAILYQDDNFSGGSTVINSDNTCLNTTWNDKVTSIRVTANGVTNLGGTYILQNRNSGLNMDVWGRSTANGANIAQGTPHGESNQQFEFTHLGNGLYKIIAKVSGKSLDVNNFNKDNGANVEQYTYNATVNQQFIVVSTDLTGCYKLIARHSGKVVEVAGASTASGANVQQWTNNNQTCGQWKFLPAVVTPPVDGTGDGLTGNYFNGMNFETPVYSRKDATINFDWGNGSPNAAVNADRFSARWTGQIQPKYSGEYTFYINSDNGRRLWINGQLVIDKWIDDWNIDYSGKISLTANQKYNIKIEYFENNGGAAAKLEWSHASQTREVVPTKQLYANNLPTVSITSPATNAVFTSPSNINFSSNAADNGGSIAKVEYYNGATKIGEATVNPYNFSWNNVAVGTYTITARATDNLGGVSVSAPLTVKVNQGTNQAPSVSLTAPANNANFNAPATINITANASDVDGSITKVEFYNGNTKLGEDASAPYALTWSNVAAGTYTISVKAFDNNNASTTSASVTVKVNTVVTDPCTGLPNYSENAGYAAGSKVKNAGKQYECKEWPYSGWCNGASWAYGPGTGAYWTDAWYERGSCNARAALDLNDQTATVTSDVAIAPNPATDQITLSSDQFDMSAAVLTIRDLTGRALIEHEGSSSMDVSTLKSGMYTLTIVTKDNQKITKQFIKQ